jgi:hypothetical protein
MRLSISYALSQSCKLSVFEEMIDRTIDKYQLVPHTLATTGKVQMTRLKVDYLIARRNGCISLAIAFYRGVKSFSILLFTVIIYKDVINKLV